MKFFEWMTVIFGLLCALAADSSIIWSLTCGILCVVSLAFMKIAEDLETEYRKNKCTMPRTSQHDAVGKKSDDVMYVFLSSKYIK